MKSTQVAHRVRDAITWLSSRRAQARDAAGLAALLTTVVCFISVAPQAGDAFEGLFDEFLRSSGILDRPFGTWTLSYLATLFLELSLVVLIGTIGAASQHVLFVPLIAAICVMWLCAR
ncbi:MAG TPA: hypothetical protein VI542_28320 [Candidatus Tectomicrobia bacterium]